MDGSRLVVYSGRLHIALPTQKTLFHLRSVLSSVVVVFVYSFATQHRDLHWGQILIQNLPFSSISERDVAARPSMDNYSSGVIATIIDLGLSRMDASPTEVHWTAFEPEVFEGEGDYQFDIYRMMRNHNGDSWREYKPLTNVMVFVPLLPARD